MPQKHFHKIRFSVKENGYPCDDHILIHVYEKKSKEVQFIIPFKTISEIKAFSDELLDAIAEIKDEYPDFAKRNE